MIVSLRYKVVSDVNCCVSIIVNSSTESKTYIIAPPYCGALGAADLDTVAWPRADDGGSGNGRDGGDLGRYVMAVGHGKDAAELDGHCVFGDAALLARRHGMPDFVVWLGSHGIGISKPTLDVLNSSVDECRLAE